MAQNLTIILSALTQKSHSQACPYLCFIKIIDQGIQLLILPPEVDGDDDNNYGILHLKQANNYSLNARYGMVNFKNQRDYN